MQQDFIDALKILPPSTLKGSIVDDIPKTTWQDIGGLEAVKQVIIMKSPLIFSFFPLLLFFLLLFLFVKS
jgi:hypothetical protein